MYIYVPIPVKGVRYDTQLLPPQESNSSKGKTGKNRGASVRGCDQLIDCGMCGRC